MEDFIRNIHKQVKELISDKSRSAELKQELIQILGLIDLTTLEGSDTDERVRNLCKKAQSFSSISKELPNSAAVCVYPSLVPVAKRELENSGIKVASVAGAFPSSQSPLVIRIAEAKYALEQGADEIDMVLSTGKFIEGDYQFNKEEVYEFKKACGDKHLKVILETGILETQENIRQAAMLAIRAGADFIKTSTGKVAVNATPEAMTTMCRVISEYYEITEAKIGIKPAGGISDPETALVYYHIVKEILGDEWLNNDLFRIGASRLADKLVDKITKL